MQSIRRYDELGKTRASWLEARHHFSFGSYYDENWINMGPLRVINDDLFRAGGGFGMHPHENMEIVTYIREGELLHRDSLGNHGIIRAGEIQVMSAGTGIVHSEYSSPGVDTRLYQIWIEPRSRGLAPRWASGTFPIESSTNSLTLLASGRESNIVRSPQALSFDADASIFGSQLAAGTTIEQSIGKYAYLLVANGDVVIRGEVLTRGDSVAISDEVRLQFETTTGAEVVLIDLL